MSDTPPPRSRRSWFLIASLCLNVILIAMLAIGLLRLLHPPGSPLGNRALIAAIPAEQPVLQKLADAHAPKLAALHHGLVQARRDAFTVLGATDYTPQKMADALAAVVAADNAYERESVSLMAQGLSALTPAERQALVKRLKNRSWLMHLLRAEPR